MVGHRRRYLGVVAILWALLALAIWRPEVGWGAPATRVQSIPLSQALDRLEHGRAQRSLVALQNGQLTLTLSVGARRLETPLPSAALIDTVVRAARAGGVPVTTERSITPPGTVPPDTAGFSFGAFLDRWGPMILLGLLVAASFLALRQVGGSRFRHRVRPVSSTVRFDDVAGMDEIRGEVSEIADVLRDPRRFTAVGATVPRGVILHGPPGTGKTLLAKAVAGEAGVPFFSASGSEFVEVYAGLGAKRIRALFEAARRAAPAVVFIDEIDAVGAARNGAPGASEREHALNQLLAEVDGFRTDPHRPVVLLASTNRLEDLDPALVRAGRFDRRIAVGVPDRAGRVSILGVHTRSRPLAPSVRLDDVAAFTAGMAGADLASLCNEAAFEAARAHRSVIERDDFRAALMRLAAGPERRNRVMPEEERRLVAFHEMGHAIVGHLLPGCDAVERVTVIPQGAALGVTIALPAEDRFLATRSDCLDRLAMLMGGRAAEELVFGEPTSGAADDLRRALALARRMVTELGMAEPTTARSLRAGIGEDAAELAARELVADALTRARDLLLANRGRLETAALRLLDVEAMERAELESLLGPRPGGGRLAARA